MDKNIIYVYRIKLSKKTWIDKGIAYSFMLRKLKIKRHNANIRQNEGI